MDIDDRRTQFTDLPSFLVMDILSRLPIKAQLICRYVRKDWVPLYFSDPYFIRLQLARSRTCMLKRRVGTGIKIRFGWIVDDEVNNFCRDTMQFGYRHQLLPFCVAECVNSCNGLICLRESKCSYSDSIVCVCNPLLGEWVSVRIPDRSSSGRASLSSRPFLGFSAKNNQYKLLHSFHLASHNSSPSMKDYGVEIYTLGSGTRQWRDIEANRRIRLPDHYSLNFNTFLHDSLHWLDHDKDRIWSFDFHEEKFRTFSLPSLEYLDPELGVSFCFEGKELGVLNSCLAVYDCYCGDIRVMKEYGDEKSWTLMLALRPRFNRYQPLLLRNCKEMMYYDCSFCCGMLLFSLNQEELMIYNDKGRLVCLNTERKRHRYCHTIGPQFGGIAYNPSFVSLHDVANGEQVMVFPQPN